MLPTLTNATITPMTPSTSQLCTIDGLPLMSADRAHGAGAAFELHERPKLAARRLMLDGWTVAVDPGSRYVSVSGGSTRSQAATSTSAYDAAQKALDFWSVEGVTSLATGDLAMANHISCWHSRSSSTVRLISSEPLDLTLSIGMIALTSPNDPPVRKNMAVDTWHESLRFFRQSQLADNFFDSVRNLWLAFENLLADRTPPAVDETEQQWVARALRDAGLTGNYERLYKELRNPSFHAKAGRHLRLPQSPDDIASLTDHYDLLAQGYLEVLTSRIGAQRAGSAWVNPELLDEVVGVFAHNPTITFSDDPRPVHKDEQEARPGHCRVVEGCIVSNASEGDGRRRILGRARAASLADLEGIRRVTIEMNGKPGYVVPVEGTIALGGVDWVEAEVALEIREAVPYRRQHQ